MRVGLLGFKRDVEGLKGEIEGRKLEVEGLLKERKRIRENVQVGRTLLEVDQRLEELEERLIIVSDRQIQNGDPDIVATEPSDSDEDSDDRECRGMSISRLRRHTQQYSYIKRLIARVGSYHPFLVKQEERVLRVKQMVLLDLSSALKQVDTTSEEDKDRLMKILALYRDMGEPKEAVKVLRETRS